MFKVLIPAVAALGLVAFTAQTQDLADTTWNLASYNNGKGGVQSLIEGTAADITFSEDGTISGLLGASPGASTAVPIMLGLLQRCFPERYAGWEPALRELIPTLGEKLNEDATAAEASMKATAAALDLTA